MHGHLIVQQRLKRRKSFVKYIDQLNTEPAQAKCNLWRGRVPSNFVPFSENLPPGHKLPWAISKVYKQASGSGFNRDCLCSAIIPSVPNTYTIEDLMMVD